MATAQAPGSELLVTVKSREVQRGLQAELRGDRAAAARHLLAAAHLELVLADDYAQAGQADLALRSRALEAGADRVLANSALMLALPSLLRGEPAPEESTERG